MKKIFYLLMTSLIIVSSCSKYDDDALWDSVNSLDRRVAALEELCKQMNTNITSLQSLVTVIQTGDYITAITPVTNNGQIIGYTIAFNKANPITI